MSAPERFNFAEIQMLIAFRKPGCPICYLKQESAQRYINSLLHENVNDASSRMHLVSGLGFCPEHTWQLYHSEINQYGDFGGIAIIYGDLVRRIVAGLRDFRTHLPPGVPTRPHWLRRAWVRLLRTSGVVRVSCPGFQPVQLVPTEPCRVCQLATDNQRNNIGWLVTGCANETFRPRFVASGGLCRTHLIEALKVAGEIRPDVALFLADVAAQHLLAVAAHLDEYSRKRAWQYRHETVTQDELEAPRKATQFFGGPDLTRLGGETNRQQGP